MNNKERATVGLAFRGAGTRSIFYVGFLEVLNEQKVPIDYIAAMSSGAIVAAAYACGTMDELKKQAMDLNSDFLYGLFERSKTKSGIYSINKVEQFLRQYTRNLRFEDVKPLMGFVAVDINEGEEVILGMGDIARAICATCSVPGIFEPAQWGNRSLVDGGLMSVIPGNVAQQVGMDVVIGVDLRATNYIFSPVQYAIRRVVKWLRSMLLLNQAQKFANWIDLQFEDSELFGPNYGNTTSLPISPGMFSVLGRSMDLALKAQKMHDEKSNFQCDILIRPVTPKKPWYHHFFLFWLTDFSSTKELYQLGRDTAEEYVPQIWQAMADAESLQKQHQDQLQKMINQN